MSWIYCYWRVAGQLHFLRKKVVSQSAVSNASHFGQSKWAFKCFFWCFRIWSKPWSISSLKTFWPHSELSQKNLILLMTVSKKLFEGMAYCYNIKHLKSFHELLWEYSFLFEAQISPCLLYVGSFLSLVANLCTEFSVIRKTL